MPRTKTVKSSTSKSVVEIKEEPDSKVKTEPDLCEIKLEEFITPSVSKKIKVSKSRPEDSTKAEEG